MKNIPQSGFLPSKIKKIFIRLRFRNRQWLSEIYHYWITIRYKITSTVTFSDRKKKKLISSRSNLKNVKKPRNRNLQVEVETKKYAENLLKKEKFYNLKCRAYSHAKLSTSKSVVRSKELSLATLEEIETAFKEYKNTEGSQFAEMMKPYKPIHTFWPLRNHQYQKKSELATR